MSPCSTPEKPTYHSSLGLEGEEPQVDRDGRSEHDRDPFAGRVLAGKQPADEGEPEDIPQQVRSIRMNQMTRQQAPASPESTAARS